MKHIPCNISCTAVGPVDASDYVGLSNCRAEVGNGGPLMVMCLTDSGVLNMAEIGESASCNMHSDG